MYKYLLKAANHIVQRIKDKSQQALAFILY